MQIEQSEYLLGDGEFLLVTIFKTKTYFPQRHCSLSRNYECMAKVRQYFCWF